MNRPRPATWAAWRRWVLGLGAGLPLAGLGCADLPRWSAEAPSSVVRAAPPGDVKPEALPPVPAVDPAAALPLAESAPTVPVSLDAVLRLAEEQNPSIALARERVSEAYAEQELAAKKWLPDLYVGASYYRHEGGIQLQEGPVITSSTNAMFGGGEINARFDIRQYAYQQILAARKSIQQRGEMKRITSETLLDAANTYIDLLAARSAIAIAQALDQDVEQLLKRLREIAPHELGKGLDVEIVRHQSERTVQAQTIRNLQAQASAAAAKLAYLLGLPPGATVEAVDAQIVMFPLVPVDVPTLELVSQALARGPGVQELRQLLDLVQEAQAKAQGPGRLMPVVQVQMAEGIFGGGPDISKTFDNRFDLGVQMRWNLTDALTTPQQRRVASSQACQAQLAYRELQGRLTLGVQEARETAAAATDRLARAEELIRQAREARRLSGVRWNNNIQGATPGEVLAAAQGVARAQGNYVNVLREYNKAQVRLLVLTGGVGGANCPPRHP